MVSPRPNAPTYALLNSDREVVAFITPAPGVNLKAMVGRQVGISGQRGYLPELRKPHITALRAMALDNPDAVAAGSGAAVRRWTSAFSTLDSWIVPRALPVVLGINSLIAEQRRTLAKPCKASGAH